MFDFLSNVFGGFNPNATVAFDPVLGKVVGTTPPGMPAGGPPAPLPRPNPLHSYGPHQPQAAPAQPPAPQPKANPGQPGAGPSAGSWSAAMKARPPPEQAYGGPDMPPMARGVPQSNLAAASPMQGDLLAYLMQQNRGFA